MRILNDDELTKAIVIHERRRKAFEQSGLSESMAFDLAEKMFERDHNPMDNRRICFECTNFNLQNKRCKDPKQRFAFPFILQRCGGFNLKGVKK
jgi:hypothetical protein